jgi:phosphoglycerol transferase
VAGATFVGTVLAYQLWRARPEVPFDLHGDARFNLMTIRNLTEQGWFQRSGRLGAPFGLDLHDFPLGGSNLQFVVLWLLALPGASAGAVMNAYLVVTFVGVAVTSAFVFRWLGLSEPVATILAVAYTFLPYHFYRGEHHLFLSAYWSVPLAAYLALSLSLGRPLFERTAGRGITGFLNRRTALTLAICAVIGSTDSYYVAYALLLVAVAGGQLALRARNLRAARPAVAVTVAVVVVLVVNLSPSVLYRQRHGPNTEVGFRFPVESEIYGLKLTNLVLPRSHHRLGLGTIAERYGQESPIPSEGGQALGLVGTVGFLWLLLFLIAAALGARLRTRAPDLHGQLAAFTLVALLAGTVGGGSMLVAYFLTPQFRSWARVSVVIAFFALAAAGSLVDGWRTTGTRRTRSAILAAIQVVALVDQTSGADVPRYRANGVEYDSDEAFVADIEHRLSPEAMVFQLPVVAFPESPRPDRMKDYDQFIGYLHSQKLRWSYGGMKGREAEWQHGLPGQPAEFLLARLAAVGFTGLTIDRFGYADNAGALEMEVSRLAGAPAVSRNGRLSFFDLTSYRDGLLRTRPPSSIQALAAATLEPVRWVSGNGFEESRADGANFWLTASDRSGSLVLRNPGTMARPVTFEATVESGGPGRVAVTVPGRGTESVDLACQRAPLRFEFAAPPGSSELRITADVPPLPAEDAPSNRPPGATVRFRLLRPTLSETAAESTVGSSPQLPRC